jgi:hypothetical protein
MKLVSLESKQKMMQLDYLDGQEKRLDVRPESEDLLV